MQVVACPSVVDDAMSVAGIWFAVGVQVDADPSAAFVYILQHVVSSKQVTDDSMVVPVQPRPFYDGPSMWCWFVLTVEANRPYRGLVQPYVTRPVTW